MFLIQLLLPKTAPSGTTLDSEVAQTRAELVKQFGGLTAYERAPAQGAWRSPEGDVERDDVIMVEVVAASFDREWWSAYKTQLERRFVQKELHVRALHITMV